MPNCLKQIPSGKFRSSTDKLHDFRETYKFKFLTKPEDLHKYTQNDEKKDEDYSNEQLD